MNRDRAACVCNDETPGRCPDGYEGRPMDSQQSTQRRRQRRAAGPACRAADPGLFFPSDDGDLPFDQVAQAKALCRRCPVQQACLAIAIRFREGDGIWGGTTPGERRRLWDQADRLRQVGPLVREVAAGKGVTVGARDRAAVVYHLIAAGWDTDRVADALGLAPAVIRAAYDRGRLAARFAAALAQELPRRVSRRRVA